ncbi:hypothetical protein C8R45DRAFT_85622 [Mycena sanguinolenta]|nr:hypothetical protein C8R45DRAFT_85622 [Mycena sanguinolenta]
MLPDGVEPLDLTSTVNELKGERQLRLTRRVVGLDPLTITQWNAVVEPSIQLRISLDEIPLSSIAPQTQIQDVLRHICTQVQHPASEYTLSIAGCAEPLAMDRTVASLEGSHDLVLSRRDVEVASGAHGVVIRISLRISPDETFLGDVSATPQMQLQDILLRICRKMKFRASEYTLAFPGSVEPLAMDLTVADLDDNRELVLLKHRPRSYTPEAWWYSTDPPKLLCDSQSFDA